MSNILLLKLQYGGFGDRLDAIGLAKIFYDKYKEPVTIHKIGGVFKDFNAMASLFDMKCNLQIHAPIMANSTEFNSYFKHDQKSVEYKELIDEIKDWPKIIPKDLDLELPDKFIVAQFDAKEDRRRVSPQERNRIINYYKDQGYEIMIVGGESKDPRFGNGPGSNDNIVYAMSKADKYIGVDSGMMHLAKYTMPTENLHVYLNDRVDNPWFSSFLTNAQKKGVKVNYSR